MIQRANLMNPQSVTDLTVQNNEIADLRISTPQDIAGIAGTISQSDQIKEKMQDWSLVTLHRFYPDDKQIYLLCDQSREPGGAVITSQLKTIDLDRGLVETRNGSLYELGTPRAGEPSAQQLALLCIAMHRIGIGSFIGVPIYMNDGTFFSVRS